MDYYFNEWYKEQDVQFLSTVREGAEVAWCYQQERIDLLEDQVDGLENELHCVRAYNDELIAELELLKRPISDDQATCRTCGAPINDLYVQAIVKQRSSKWR